MGLPVDTLPPHFYTLVCCLSDKLRGQLAFTPTSPLRQNQGGLPHRGEGKYWREGLGEGEQDASLVVTKSLHEQTFQRDHHRCCSNCMF
jgi:hypothetical protein